MYQSILPKRTRDVQSSDFDEFTGRFALAKECDASSITSFWNDRIPYYPTQIYELFCGNFVEEITFAFNRDYRDGLKFHIIPKKSKNFETYFTYYSGSIRRFIDSSRIGVNPAQQRAGLGKACMKGRLEFAVAMGMTGHSFEAGSYVGGYTWASMGASMDMAEWDNPAGPDKESFTNVLFGRLEVARPFMSEEDYQQALQHCFCADQNDLVHLAEMKHIALPMPQDITPQGLFLGRIGETLRRYFAMHCPSKYASDWSETSAERECKDLSGVFKGAAVRNIPLSFPAFMLCMSFWPARIDFQDTAQMERIGRYLGGWRTIAPMPAQTLPQRVLAFTD